MRTSDQMELEAESGALVGSLPTEEQVAELLEKPVEPEKKEPELTADQKQRIENRKARFEKRMRKQGKIHGGAPGDIIQMSDRHYEVAKDGSFRFVRML